jgi:hypothetical protein
MQKSVFFVLLFISLNSISQPRLAPESPATSNMGGGSVSITSDFILDWSIGESTIIETYFGENSYSNSVVGINWNVTSGILQPFDKTHTVYNFLVPKWTNEEIRFYPIPTPNIVYIDFRSVTTGKMSVQLLSREGKLLGIKEFYQNNSTSILKWDLTNKPSGVYFFRILLSAANGDILKQGTFNIEKL